MDTDLQLPRGCLRRLQNDAFSSLRLEEGFLMEEQETGCSFVDMDREKRNREGVLELDQLDLMLRG